MKNYLFVCFLLTLTFKVIQAQSDQYVPAMEKALNYLEEEMTTEKLQEAVNLFGRIAAVETSEWLPVYYQALGHIQLAIAAMQQQEMEQCAAYLDAAQKELDRAKVLAPDNVELTALQSYIYTGRIWEDPQTNGPQFSPLAMQTLAGAISRDEENPRLHYLLGQHLFYTPTFWGGGPKAALPHLQKAEEKFEAFKPVSPLHPKWGRDRNRYLLLKAVEASKEQND